MGSLDRPDQQLPTGFDYIDLMELLSATEGLLTFSRAGTFDEVDGERDAVDRARKILDRYGIAT